MKWLITTLTILFFACTNLHARPSNFMLSDKNLSSSLINNIFQDSEGMIWIATENGLNRYDGTKVSTYKHSDDGENSLAHNYIFFTYQDRKGNIYVGTYIGLQLYRPDTDDFSPIGAFADGSKLLSSPSYITETLDGRIFISGNELCEVTIHDGQPVLEHVEWEGVSGGIAGKLFLSKDGCLWCHMINVAIFRIYPNETVQRMPGNEPFSSIADLMTDGCGNIFVHSDDRDLYKFDFDNNRWQKINRAPISSSALKCIFRLDDTHILIGTDGNGIKMIDEQTGEVTPYVVDLPSLTSRYLKVHQIIRDKDGDLWTALFLKGIARLPMRQTDFGYLGSQSNEANLVGSSSISAILADRKGQMWMGTDGQGLYRLDKDLSDSYHYPTKTDGGSMPPIIQALYEDSEGTIWVGSYDDGCGRIDPDNGRFTSLKGIFKMLDKPAMRIYGFSEDRRHRLWVASLGQGLFCYDVKRHAVIDSLAFSTGINRWQTCLLINSDEQLLIGSYDGIYAIDLKQPHLTPRQIVDRIIIFGLYEDKQQRLWAASASGLIQFSLDKGVISTFTPKEGLAGNAAYAIQGDLSGRLWVSTNRGLSLFDPGTEHFTNFGDGDGLQGNEFSKNASCIDLQDRLWFGGAYGINFFLPGRIQHEAHQLDVRMTGLYLNNEAINARRLSGGKPIVAGAVHLADSFELSHADNTFSIELSTVQFSDPDAIQYYYSVNNGEWTSLPLGSHLVSFSDLQPGTYHFAFKASSDGSFSTPREVLITIRPYWWESTWARCLYVVAFLLLCYAFFFQMYRHFKTRRQMLIQSHAHEIDEAKLRFFTNITHEIRTPMTLIISPLQKLMGTDNDPTRQKAYKTMFRNARMLLQLANQLLDIRKIDNRQMRLTFHETDIIALIHELSDYFQPIADQKKIRYSFIHDGLETFNLWVDPGYFNKIIINLLSNAFKYTEDEGEVTLTVKHVRPLDGSHPYALITVTDSGMGIAEEDLEMIFERFYRTRDAHRSTEGNGIGLHLTQSLVTLHHGTIKASNNESGKGSTFTVKLPVGNEHLNASEISNLPAEDPHTIIDTTQTEIVLDEEETQSHGATRKKYRLLIVDDETEIRSYLKSELESDFHIAECENGEDALQKAFRFKPDLIISDVMMPLIDGFTLCQRIKQNISLNHIPVILLTAKADQESNLLGLDSGADAFLTKPFYIEILRKTALNLVRTRSQLRNVYNGQQIQTDKLDDIDLPSANDRLMERIMQSVNQNIKNPEYSIDDLCKDVGISRVHLYRKLKELTNQSPRDFIRNVRLKQAERILLKGDYSIKEVAEAVGYTRQNNFSAAFKELYGYPPLQWRAIQLHQPMPEATDDDTDDAGQEPS